MQSPSWLTARDVVSCFEISARSGESLKKDDNDGKSDSNGNFFDKSRLLFGMRFVKHFKVSFSFCLLGEYALLKTSSFKISKILQSILNFSLDTLDSLVQVSYAQDKSGCVSFNFPHFTQKAYIYSIHISICALTPKKCKIMAFDFLHYNSFQCPPVATYAVFWKRSSLLNFLEFLYPTTWPGRCIVIT